jgi:D-hydroxyproline dehydrogenase subunit alpha
MEARYQVIVLGGGPAGLNAAKYAANAGYEVGLLDAGTRLGGQYWRHTGREEFDQSVHHNFDQGSLLIDAVLANSRITIHSETNIWSASVINDEIVLRANSGAFITQRLILATGAYDRSLPFPGWDLPGVMTPGAAQSMLKGQGVVVGKRIVVAGTGPFLLPVAAGLSEHGAEIVGLLEASSQYSWFNQAIALLRNPSKAFEGLGYLRTLRSGKVGLRFREAIVAAHAGDDRSLESITVAKIDSQWKIQSTYKLSCDVAAVGWGFTADTAIASALGLALDVDTTGSISVVVDDNQRAIQPNSAIEIYVAGELTGIGGSDLALVEGAIAGSAIAGSTQDLKILKKRREKLRGFAEALTKVYPVQLGWKSWLSDQTIICRCEEISYSDINEAREEFDASDARTIKLLTRCGMGLCQGRVCSRYIADIVNSGAVERINSAARPILSPITLGEVAQEGLL